MRKRSLLVGVLAGVLSASHLCYGRAPAYGGDDQSILDDFTCVGMSQIADPMPLTTPTPHYPASAIRSHISGVVEVHAIIDLDGVIRNSTVFRRSHPSLVPASLAALALWRYRPGTIGGDPVRALISIMFTYTLSISPECKAILGHRRTPPNPSLQRTRFARR